MDKDLRLSLSSDKYDYIFKILILGDAGVGKSSLLLRFTDGVFNRAYRSTVGVDFKIHTLDIEGKIIKAQIWDTAGQERFRVITNAYYRGANGIILVYDITSKESFVNLERIWLKEVNSQCDDGVKKIIVGNKCDRTAERVVDTKSVRGFAEENEIAFMETSAKDSINVREAFRLLIAEIKDGMQSGISAENKRKLHELRAEFQDLSEKENALGYQMNLLEAERELNDLTDKLKPDQLTSSQILKKKELTENVQLLAKKVAATGKKEYVAEKDSSGLTELLKKVEADKEGITAKITEILNTGEKKAFEAAGSQKIDVEDEPVTLEPEESHEPAPASSSKCC